MPGALVVKKGSKRCERVSADMPSPVSAMDRSTASPTTEPGAFLAESRKVPPSGMASRALAARFITI